MPWLRSPIGRIKAPPAALHEVLRGRVTDHYRFLLKLHLQQIDALDTWLGLLSQVALDFSTGLAHNRGVRGTVDGREEATLAARIPEVVPRRG
ncbi:MAG TPA: hypothetical protein VGF39_02075, partial [Stellaceae bacterium]